MHGDITVSGRVVNVSGYKEFSASRGRFRSDYVHVYIQAKNTIIKVYLPSSKMGLGPVGKGGKTASIIQVKDEKTGRWFPSTLINPTRILGKAVTACGSVVPCEEGLYMNKLTSLKVS